MSFNFYQGMDSQAQISYFGECWSMFAQVFDIMVGKTFVYSKSWDDLPQRGILHQSKLCGTCLLESSLKISTDGIVKDASRPYRPNSCVC